MRRTVSALLVTGTLLAAPPPAVAQDVTADVSSDMCTLLAATDLSFPSVRTGFVMGRPMQGDGRLKCTVQVGYGTHAGPDAASASASGTDVVVLRPNMVSYPGPPDVPIYLCAEYLPWASPPQYWDPTGFWSPSENTPCNLASSFGTNDPLFDVVDAAKEAFDATACPGLAALHAVFTDPAGPVYVSASGDVDAGGSRVWNCPPY